MDDLIYNYVNAQRDANAANLRLRQALSDKLGIATSEVEVDLEYNNYEELILIRIYGKLSKDDMNKLDYDFFDGCCLVIKVGDIIL